MPSIAHQTSDSKCQSQNVAGIHWGLLETLTQKIAFCYSYSGYFNLNQNVCCHTDITIYRTIGATCMPLQLRKNTVLRRRLHFVESPLLLNIVFSWGTLRETTIPAGTLSHFSQIRLPSMSARICPVCLHLHLWEKTMFLGPITSSWGILISILGPIYATQLYLVPAQLWMDFCFIISLGKCILFYS